MKNKLFNVLLIWMIIIMLVGIISAIMSSCNPERKIQKAISTIKGADRLDDLCAENYPCAEDYIRGDTVFVFDTLYERGYIIDTFTVDNIVYIQKTSKPVTIVKTKIIVDTVMKRDIAFENVLKDRLDSVSRSNYLLIKDKDKTTGERDKYKGRSKTYLWILIALALILFSKTFFNIYKLLKGGISIGKKTS
jgi:hypothetical protein